MLGVGSRRAALLALTLAAVLLASSGCSRAGRPAAPPDVFVIVVDTLRADALRSYRPELAVGDALAELAADGVVLEQLRASSSWTRSSIATLFTGKTVGRHRVFGRLDVLSASHDVLPELLAERGYATHAWITNPNVLGVWGFARGFERFHDLTGQRPGRGPIEGAEVIEHVVRALAEAPEGPVFGYVHVSDPHNPYVPGEEDLAAVRPFAATHFPGRLEGVRGRQAFDDYAPYLGEVRDIDRALGTLFAFLRAEGRYDDAVILVVSDHGEEFADHGWVGHGHTLFDELLLVPGILKLPGGAHAGRRLAAPTEYTDLLPTVLAAAGLEAPEGLRGRNLLGWLAGGTPPEAEGFYATTVDNARLSALRSGRHKLILDHRTGRARLYDVVEDPRERRDLAGEQPERVAELLERLRGSEELHEPGWHLRGCGCRAPGGLGFRLEGVTGLARSASLEEGDQLAGADGATEVAWQLVGRRADTPPAFGVPRVAPDVDDLLAGDPERLVLVPPPGAGTPLALRNEEPEPLTEPLDLVAARDRATVPSNEPISCDPTGAVFWGRGPACRPHLRVWYVAPGDSMREDAVDPGLRERLRALGYDW